MTDVPVDPPAPDDLPPVDPDTGGAGPVPDDFPDHPDVVTDATS